jgi:hypothetical protein
MSDTTYNWPRSTPTGPVWACCVSSIGPTCRHREPPEAMSEPVNA